MIEAGLWISAAILTACIIGWLILNSLNKSRGDGT